MKADNKLNSSKIVVLNAISFMFALIGMLIYKLIPVSDLANGIEHSPKDALYALLISPIAFFTAAFLFGLIFKDFKLLQERIDKAILIPVGLIGEGSLIFSFISTLVFCVDEFKLGFVAPVDGTVWATIGTVITVFTVVFFLITVGTVYILKIRSKK